MHVLPYAPYEADFMHNHPGGPISDDTTEEEFQEVPIPYIPVLFSIVFFTVLKSIVLSTGTEG